jgi:DNA-binding response OmpR family regulator
LREYLKSTLTGSDAPDVEQTDITPDLSNDPARAVLAEDNWALRECLETMLTRRGLRVQTVRTVAEAMKALRTPPRFLLLDINLADGLGTEVLREVRAARLRTRVAVLTGCGSPSLLAEVTLLQPDLLLMKPFSLKPLLSWLRLDAVPSSAPKPPT